jgi:chromosome condensin MukBEF complex kleisin-like MukF subunit
MFQGLRTNSLFYVLDKGENPNLRIGQVVSVSNPQTKYPTFNNGFTPQPMETVVDVKVKLGDEEVDFKQLPANGQIANDKNLVVSDNKDAMSAEVDAMLRQSKAILESVDYNKRVVESCEGMLQQLNPQIAKDKEQTEKINKLEGKVSDIEGKIDKMMGWLQQTMSK